MSSRSFAKEILSGGINIDLIKVASRLRIVGQLSKLPNMSGLGIRGQKPVSEILSGMRSRVAQTRPSISQISNSQGMRLKTPPRQVITANDLTPNYRDLSNHMNGFIPDVTSSQISSSGATVAQAAGGAANNSIKANRKPNRFFRAAKNTGLGIAAAGGIGVAGLAYGAMNRPPTSDFTAMSGY